MSVRNYNLFVVAQLPMLFQKKANLDLFWSFPSRNIYSDQLCTLYRSSITEQWLEKTLNPETTSCNEVSFSEWDVCVGRMLFLELNQTLSLSQLGNEKKKYDARLKSLNSKPFNSLGGK